MCRSDAFLIHPQSKMAMNHFLGISFLKGDLEEREKQMERQIYLADSSSGWEVCAS